MQLFKACKPRCRWSTTARWASCVCCCRRHCRAGTCCSGKLLAGVALSVLQAYAFMIVALIFGIEIPLWGYVSVLPALVLAGLMIGALGLVMSVTIRQLENFAG